jgi:two-component system osmolarity sensor histidine kinase EnvZ
MFFDRIVKIQSLQYWRHVVKNLLPHTLFGRALLIIVTPLVLVQLISTVIFYDRHWQQISRRLSSAVVGELALTLELMQQFPDPGYHRWLFDQVARTTSLLMSFEPGARLDMAANPDWQDPYLRDSLQKALREKIPLAVTINPQISREWVEISIQTPQGVLRVMSPMRRFFSSTTYIFIFWMLGSSVLLFSIALIFMRNQIRPIRRLATAAENFGKGRTDISFKPEGASEVRQAGKAFLDMQERLRRQIDQRTFFLAGVSHDLRTPLTRMRLALELLPDNAESTEIRADILEMEQMIDSYLAFARGEDDEAVTRIDLGVLLLDLIEKSRRSGGIITIIADPGVMMMARPMAFRRCLTNLLVNANRYAKELWIEVIVKDHEIMIIFDDNGPGIPASRRDDVFKPFMRLDDSRNSATGGTGLGLTVARDIARRHGGDITLDSSPRGGLRVLMTIPQ